MAEPEPTTETTTEPRPTQWSGYPAAECQHSPTRIIAETGFCFACWETRNALQRAKRRTELEDCLRRGLIVRQSGTFWSTAGVILTRFGVRADAIFIEPYSSDPVYLAEHLENREHGLGFPTTILHTEL